MRISIVTINLNNFEGLKRTVESVENQSSLDLEYIVVDGESTDGSLDLIRNSHCISKWISEKDNGVFHAMNKGVKLATSDYILFINSGDYLVSDTIVEMINSLSFSEDLVSGNVLIKGNKEEYIKESPNILTSKYLMSDYLPHPATLIKKQLFEKYGYFNEGNKIVSDWEFFLKCYLLYRVSYLHISITVSVFMADGLSCKPEYAKLIAQEKENVLNKYFFYIKQDYYELINLELSSQEQKLSHEYKAKQNQKKIYLVYIAIFFMKFKKKISELFKRNIRSIS